MLLSKSNAGENQAATALVNISKSLAAQLKTISAYNQKAELNAANKTKIEAFLQKLK